MGNISSPGVLPKMVLCRCGTILHLSLALLRLGEGETFEGWDCGNGVAGDGPSPLPPGTRPGCGCWQLPLAGGQGSCNPGSRQSMGKKYPPTSLSSMMTPGSCWQKNKTMEKGFGVFFSPFFCGLVLLPALEGQ